MLFSRFFSKDYSQLKAKGDKLFAAGHFAEARSMYGEAIDKSASAGIGPDEVNYLKSQISLSGNRLAEINIVEAESCLHNGNAGKAIEHLNLSLELADDVMLREKAENLLECAVDDQQGRRTEESHQQKHGCATCSSSTTKQVETHDHSLDHLTAAERFHLLINTLPGDLPHRYAQLGEKFATAYLLAHAEEPYEALSLFNDLPGKNENDIILYENAILHFRTGDLATCENLLKRAMQINDANPLCYLGLAQLYTGSERYDEAITILSKMLDLEILPDQALIMLGDVHTFQGNFDKSIDIFRSALDNPSLKKVSAERLVRILSSQGREEEAAYLAKTYLKGCC
jgi:tetratricopeptide (TPR) repeat protein